MRPRSIADRNDESRKNTPFLLLLQIDIQSAGGSARAKAIPNRQSFAGRLLQTDLCRLNLRPPSRLLQVCTNNIAKLNAAHSA